MWNRFRRGVRSRQPSERVVLDCCRCKESVTVFSARHNTALNLTVKQRSDIVRQRMWTSAVSQCIKWECNGVTYACTITNMLATLSGCLSFGQFYSATKARDTSQRFSWFLVNWSHHEIGASVTERSEELQLLTATTYLRDWYNLYSSWKTQESLFWMLCGSLSIASTDAIHSAKNFRNRQNCQSELPRMTILKRIQSMPHEWRET
jgi:hypothetical protein